MCSAWHSVSPAASNSAVEQSRRSLMLVECEARISASPVSSTIEARAAPITSTVIGSTWTRAIAIAHAASRIRLR